MDELNREQSTAIVFLMNEDVLKAGKGNYVT